MSILPATLDKGSQALFDVGPRMSFLATANFLIVGQIAKHIPERYLVYTKPFAAVWSVHSMLVISRKKDMLSSHNCRDHCV